MKKFSDKYSSFNEWLVDNTQRTDYKKRIIRLHHLYPDASLGELRGHAKKKGKTLSARKAIAVSKRAWSVLSPREKLARERSLQVLGDVRRNKKSLAWASKDRGISFKTVLKNTGAFKKIEGKWTVKKYDRISRYMRINEEGREVSVEIKDSRTATLIGRYHNAVKKYLETGDPSGLLEYTGVAIRDASGQYHLLETDPDAIVSIAEAREEQEFYDIYNL